MMTSDFELPNIIKWGRKVGESYQGWTILEIHNGNPCESFLPTDIVLDSELATVSVKRETVAHQWMIDTIVWK
jgi:hypothetical protein